jgi:hypothetical protein
MNMFNPEIHSAHQNHMVKVFIIIPLLPEPQCGRRWFYSLGCHATKQPYSLLRAYFPEGRSV